MDVLLIGVSTLLVAVFIFTLSLSWVVAQLASSYSTKIIDLYFGRTTKLYLTLLLLNIAYPWIVILWFSEPFKKPCTIFSLASGFFCFVMMMIYVFDMKKNVRPETLVKLTLDEAQQELREDEDEDNGSSQRNYLYQISQLEVVEEILYKAIENVNNGLIEYGFWQYLKYTKKVFSLKSESALRIRVHTINYLTSVLLHVVYTHRSLCFEIIQDRVIMRMIYETEIEKEKYIDFLAELEGGIMTRINGEIFVSTLPGTSLIKKQFISRCIICALFIDVEWHEKMDISQEVAFQQLLGILIDSKTKDSGYFRENFRHAKEIIKNYSPELNKHLDSLKKMLEKKAEEQLKQNSFF